MGNRAFYKNFYSSQQTEPSKPNEFLNIETPTLTLNNHNFCEGYIAENKLQLVLHMMENNKSPGVHGLSTNFYTCLRPIFGNELTQVYNYAFDHGHLPLTQRRGVISLLSKKGDRTQLQNWRPITLLNMDYKILTKALANRPKHTLPFLVQTDQIACIPERTINDNQQLIQDQLHMRMK